MLKAEESYSKIQISIALKICMMMKGKTATQQQNATESRKPKLPKDPGNNTPTRNSGEVTPSPLAMTVIIGDSIIKRVQGQKFGRRVVKYFSGASTSDMKHHIKPTLHKAPQKIVLHIGTNDLRDTAVADNIVDIARQIENESDAKVVISELVTRNDRENLREAVQVVNKPLSKFCNQNGWKLIEHKNINNKDLNNSRLHLNDSGNIKICNSLVNYLEGCFN